jgi:NitT/TauT family transport system substrate-binding protein
MSRLKISTMIAVALTAVMTLAGCGGGNTAGSPQDPAGKDRVTIQLDYQPRGNHSVFYVADKLGYFAEQGIVVDKILPGKSSGDTLRLVGTGQANFGMADLPTLVVSRSQNVPVKAIAAVNQKSPLGMCTLAKKHPLSNPNDLKGLSVGVQSSGSTYVFYKALLAANGIPANALTERSVQPPYENYLLTGQVDTVPCYSDAEVPILEEHAGGSGSLSILPGSSWGYDTYGSGVFTSDEVIKNNPDLVQRFTNAYVKAFAQVIARPDEAAKILAESSPQLAGNVELYKKQLAADISDSFENDQTRANGLGSMNDATWQKTISILGQQGVTKSSPAVPDVQDSSFVTKAAGAGK